MTQQEHPQSTGKWISDDTTDHRIEAQLTDIEANTGDGLVRLVALRNTQQPGNVFTCTPGELAKFTQSAQQGSVGKMLQAAGGGRPSR